VHGVVPSLSRVGIELPSVCLFSDCPIGNFETLEHSSGSSVECYFSHSLKEGIWVEVLSKNMMLNVRLLVEFIAIEILNSNTYIILN
jgi:hypothetical protein